MAANEDGSLQFQGFSRWACCMCVVTFDLELGQAMEVSGLTDLLHTTSFTRLLLFLSILFYTFCFCTYFVSILFYNFCFCTYFVSIIFYTFVLVRIS